MLVTREPGGTPEAEQSAPCSCPATTAAGRATAEALLNYAARESALEPGDPARLWPQDHVVLCDRFMDSTRAYQGYAGGCEHGASSMHSRRRCRWRDPAGPDAGLRSRSREQGLPAPRPGAMRAEDRYERKGLDFHRSLRRVSSISCVASQSAAGLSMRRSPSMTCRRRSGPSSAGAL